MTNAERQRKWIAKNRALHNLRRRNARKNLGGENRRTRSVVDEVERPSASVGELEVPTSHEADEWDTSVEKSAPTQKLPFETKKVGEFRMLVMPPKEVEERAEMPVVKPKVFFNDHGAQISERVWNDLQEKKRVALESGYEFDPQ